MLKFLLLAAAVVVALFLIRKFARPGTPGVPGKQTPEKRAPENMVRCARCGVNLPQSEALCDRGVCVCPPDEACNRESR